VVFVGVLLKFQVSACLPGSDTFFATVRGALMSRPYRSNADTERSVERMLERRQPAKICFNMSSTAEHASNSPKSELALSLAWGVRRGLEGTGCANYSKTCKFS
jgi:hypothetical protein